MKFLIGTTAAGTSVAFCLKQGWSITRLYSAVQFGIIGDSPTPDPPNSAFTGHVEAPVARAKVHVRRTS